MNEKEEAAFRRIYQFYQKWRETIIETPEQWVGLAEEYADVYREIDADHNPLGQHLLAAVMDTIGDLYSGGMKPVPANYFGRDDL